MQLHDIALLILVIYFFVNHIFVNVELFIMQNETVLSVVNISIHNIKHHISKCKCQNRQLMEYGELYNRINPSMEFPHSEFG